MIERHDYLEQLKRAAKRSPVTALLGPRQCGKTTLAKIFSRHQKAAYFDLESQVDLNRLQNPETTLGSIDRLVILDEVQKSLKRPKRGKKKNPEFEELDTRIIKILKKNPRLSAKEVYYRLQQRNFKVPYLWLPYKYKKRQP